MYEATVFIRQGCHLCEAFMEELDAQAGQWPLRRVATVDIDSNPALRALYDTRVPVLQINGEDICQYFLDPASLMAYFESQPK